MTTEDPVTPSFVISSAIRTGSSTGAEVSAAMVGEELYWTIDIPGKLVSLKSNGNETVLQETCPQ